AISTSAVRNGNRCVTATTNPAEITITTVAEPSAAQKYSITMATVVLAKREPTSAPSTTTAGLPSHHGSVTCTTSPPWRMAEPAMAPNSSPPGNLTQCIRSASVVDTPTSTANSASEPAATAARVDGGVLAANPNS